MSNLEGVVATVLLPVGVIAATTVVPWLTVLLHELAHAAAAVLLGGRVLAGHVGSGTHVLPVRWFGARWELRLRPSHGLVHFVVPAGRWFRARKAIVLLMGPVTSTALAAGLWAAVVAAGEHVKRGEVTVLGPAVLAGAIGAAVCTWLAGLSWLPLHIRLQDGQWLPADMLAIGQLLRGPAPDPAEVAAAQRHLLAAHDAWEAFLDGDQQRALQLHLAQPRVAGDEVPFLMQQAVLSWPVEGAAAALQLLDLAAARLAAQNRSGAIDPDAAHETELAMAVNRAFFAAVDDDPALLRRADRESRELVLLSSSNPAALRTRGLVQLRLGNVTAGMNLLWRAWRLPEPSWLRSLCALYLAYGHALRGEFAAARRMRGRARRLHAHNPLLVDYGARIDALQRAAAADPQHDPAARRPRRGES